MPKLEAVAAGEDLANAQPVADARGGFEAEQAARGGAGELGRLLERNAGLEGGNAGLDDGPEPVPLPLLVRLAPLRRGAERAQMGVADRRFRQPGGERPFREAGPA